MTKVKVKEKSLFIGKPVFPLVEVMVIASFIFIIVISIVQFQKDGDIYRIWTISVVTVALTILGLLFNSTNKTLILTKDKIKIKKWIYGKWELDIKVVRGFDLKEEYDRFGTAKNIRLWIDDKKHILFTNGNYSDISVLVEGLKKAGVPFMGTKIIVSKYKTIIKWFMIISGGLATLGFLLVQIL